MRKYSKCKKPKKSSSVEWIVADDIKQRVEYLVEILKISWLDTSRVFCFRSNYSKTRAYARNWGLPRLWQMALKQKPAYIIEVISEKFDRLSQKQKDRILLHEIAHIPKNFSGSLLPHIKKGKNNFFNKVNELVYQLNRSSNKL